MVPKFRGLFEFVVCWLPSPIEVDSKLQAFAFMEILEMQNKICILQKEGRVAILGRKVCSAKFD